MWEYLSQLTNVLLALWLLSCTVTPVIVFAEDTISITSETHSSVSTGGQDGQSGQDGLEGQDGKDGQKGKDGADGADGKDGKARASITTTASGTGVEVIRIESSVNGQTFVEQEIDTSFGEEVDVLVTSTSSPDTTASLEASSSATIKVSSWQSISGFFNELQVIIFTYVSNLF